MATNFNTFLKKFREKSGSASMLESRYGEPTYWISTGSMALNRICSGSIKKGIPAGKITILAGESSTGKTLIASTIIANALKDGCTHVFYFDAEGGADRTFFENCGCDPDKIEQVLVSSVEDAQIKILEVFNMILEYHEKDPSSKFLCVLDSLGALVPMKLFKDAEKDAVKSEMGGRAKICLLPDTLVLMSDGTMKMIKDIKIGDEVMTHKNNSKKVLDNIKSFHERYIDVLCNGEKISMSLYHKMLIHRNNEEMFCQAQDLMMETDKFVDLDGNELNIDSIEIIENETDMYDIEVEDDHTFCITNSKIISHNCNNMIKAITIPALKSETPMIIINHVYDNPGDMFTHKIKEQGGGKGIKYMGTLNIQCTNNLEKTEEKNSESFYGMNKLSFFTVKNRLCRPSLQCDIWIDFKKGFTRQFEALFDEAVRGGFILNPKLGYYTVPSWKDPEKCFRKSQLISNKGKEIWMTFLSDFDEWSQKDLAYKALNQDDDDDDDIDENTEDINTNEDIDNIEASDE